MSKRCVIYGAGSVGKLAKQIIEDSPSLQEELNLIGFIDDDPSLKKKLFSTLPIFGGINELKNLKVTAIIIAFSNGASREKVYSKIIKSFPFIGFPSLIHPLAYLGSNVNLGQGSIIYPGVCIDPDVKIGCFNILNKMVTVGHDTMIDDYVTISPGVNIGGYNKILKGAFFGINSSSLQFMSIGMDSKVGAGAVITKDVNDFDTVVGVPAKSIL